MHSSDTRCVGNDSFRTHAPAGPAIPTKLQIARPGHPLSPIISPGTDGRLSTNGKHGAPTSTRSRPGIGAQTRPPRARSPGNGPKRAGIDSHATSAQGCEEGGAAGARPGRMRARLV